MSGIPTVPGRDDYHPAGDGWRATSSNIQIWNDTKSRIQWNCWCEDASDPEACLHKFKKKLGKILQKIMKNFTKNYGKFT